MNKETSANTPALSAIFPFSGKKTWIVNTVGFLEILFGIFMLIFPLGTGLATVWVGGIFVLFLAGARIVQLFNGSGMSGFFWNLLSVVLLLILGVYMLNNTVAALGIWTLVIGFYILVMGISRLILGLRIKGRSGFGWALCNAIISILLGVLIIFGWPSSTIWFIGTLVGIEFIITGWTLITFGIIAKKVTKGA